MALSLLERALGAGSIKAASILADSKFFKTKDFVKTNLPILNIAFSGDLDGGLVPGLTMLAGESKSFKTLLGLYSLKAYLDKYPQGIALLYDSEFGITPEYLKTYGIDTARIVHIPLEHIEQLKFDMVNRLKEFTDKDRVFILIDSVGNLASKKEVEDAENEKSVADMSRAKALKSLFRIVTPHLTTKNIPCIAINHVYSSLELYAKTIVGGGTGSYYSSQQIFIISKAQDKESDGTLAGFKFTITIEKSRFVKEKSKLPFTVSFNNGIKKYSGLLDLALESGDIIKPKNGWYQLIGEDGEPVGSNIRADKTETKEVLGVVIERESFKEFVRSKFKLANNYTEKEYNEDDIGEEDLDDGRETDTEGSN